MVRDAFLGDHTPDHLNPRAEMSDVASARTPVAACSQTRSSDEAELLRRHQPPPNVPDISHGIPQPALSASALPAGPGSVSSTRLTRWPA